jgi:malonyl-CoA/methylmalonyl-CoA synthetase
MLTHHNLWTNAEVLTKAWHFTDRDILLHALPVFHTHGLFVATNTSMIAGGSMIFLPAFQIDAMIERLPLATSMMGVPTFYTRLLDDKRFTGELVKHIRLFVSGSAPLLAETHVEFEHRTGHCILERYGMTETSMNTSNPYQGDRRAGTVGPALPGIEIRVVSTEAGGPIPANEVGAVQVRGPNVFKGYWKMPEKTAEEFTDDGFFITGDLGKLSEDHYLTIVGRDKDLIISGGYNIYPKEIELLLDAIDGVRESAVIGVPHPDFGEGVVAILTGNSLPSNDHIRAMIKNEIAKFKQPKKYFHLDQLPRNSMGKIQKNVLRQQYADCFQS